MKTVLAAFLPAVLLLTLSGCPQQPPPPDGGGNGNGAEPLEDPIPEPIAASDLQIRLTTVATDLTAPNWGISPPGRANSLAVADQVGILWMVDVTSGATTMFLDVRDRLVDLGIGGPGSFDERGLLGVAFAPDFRDNGLLYTYTSEPAAGPADFSTIPANQEPNHQSVVIEWRVPNPTDDAAVVDPASARVLIRVDEPQFNHNGGALTFGPDGMLYIALGDGGAADDQGVGHGRDGNAQDLGTVLGKLLRIDPGGSDSANGQYGIPPDNPFVGQDGALGEIFAYGFRNPFRVSFDSLTGNLWVADVGQNDIEEVNLVTAGGNYGWRLKEGSFFFDANGDADGFVTAEPVGDVPDDLTDPIAEYDHDEGVAVIGGFVYQGVAIPELRGRYVFGELQSRLFHLDAGSNIREFDFQDRDELDLSVLGFAEDGNGNLYVLANTTGVPFGNTGMILRIDPPLEEP